jgi:hypothetical protein
MLLCLTYVAYFQSSQIIELNDTIISLKNNQDSVLSILETRNLEISTLKDEVNKMKGVVNIATAIDSDIIRASNKMTQFYIKIIGSIILITTVGFTIYYFVPSFIVFSNYLPAPVFNFIQDHTYFFQTTQTFSKIDSINDLLWLVIIKNNKHLDIQIKQKNTPDYESAINFVTSLYEKSNILNNSSIPTDLFTQPIVSKIMESGASIESVTAAYSNFF